MGKRSGRKRKRSSANANLVDVEVLPADDQHPNKFVGQWSPQPWNQWLSNGSNYQQPQKCWNRQPSYSKNPWSSESWHDKANWYSYSWSQTTQQALKNIRAPLQNDSMSRPFLLQAPSSFSQPVHRSSTLSEYSRYGPRYDTRNPIPSYYQRNFCAASHSKGKARAISTHKLCPNVSAGNRGNLKAVPVDTNTTQSSLNGISEIGTERASIESSPLRKVEMNRNLGLQVQVGSIDAAGEEDVHYLYSVEPSEGKLVELVDLSEDSQIFENQELLPPESKNAYIDSNSNSEVSDSTSLKDFACDDPTNTMMVNKEKEKSDAEDTPKESGATGDAYCSVCNKSFKELLNNRCDLYSARCGHLFCGLCINRLKIKSKCIQCKETISSLRKIVL